MTEENVSAGGVAAPGGQGREQRFVALADAYRREGLLDDAVRILRAGMVGQPHSRSGRLLLAEVLVALGKLDEALVEARRLEGSAPEDPRVERLLRRIRAEGGDLALPPVESASEPGVLFLDGEPPSGQPLVSATLAGLYQRQGEAERAAEIAREVARVRDADRCAAWLDGIRDGRSTQCLARDGQVIAGTSRPDPSQASGRLEGWTLVLQEARELAELLGWGPVRTLSAVRGDARDAFAPVAEGGAVLIRGGREALPGQLRARAGQAAREIDGASPR